MAQIITLFCILISISLFAYIIIPQITSNIITFVSNFESYRQTSIQMIKNVFIQLGLSDEIINTIMQSIGNLTNQIFNLLNSLIPFIIGMIRTIMSSITNLVFGILIAIYLIISKDTILKQTNRVAKVFLSEKWYLILHEYFLLTLNTFSKFISSQFIEAIIIGILCYIGCRLLNLQYASIVSLILGVTNVVPVFGAIVGTLISALLIGIANPIQGLIFLLYGICLQQVESNLIYPHVVGSSVGLPPLWVLFAVSIGGGLFGIYGMLFGLPIFSIVYEIIKRYFIKKEKIKTKN